MSSLFTTTTTTTDDSSQSSSSSSSSPATTTASGSIHDDPLQGGAEFGVSRKSKRAKVMEDGEGEELEGRPPYLHVCSWLFVLLRMEKYLTDLLTCWGEVNDSRGYWRNVR